MKKIDDDLLLQLHREGKSLGQIAKSFNCSKTAVHKRLKKLLTSPTSPSNFSVNLTKLDISENLRKPEINKNIQNPIQQSTIPSGKYIRKIGTSEVFAFSPYLMQRGDMAPYTGPIPIPEDFKIPELEKALLELMNNAAVNQYGNRGK